MQNILFYFLAFKMNLFLFFVLFFFCIIFHFVPLTWAEFEEKSIEAMGEKRTKRGEEAKCVNIKDQIEEVTIEGRRGEVAILEGPCFSECRQKIAQGISKSIWQRIKGIFGGGSDNEKKRSEEAKCFLQCFCR